MTDCLVASRAIVFLPVREGQEEAALALLKEASEHVEEIADEFVTFRESRFAPMPNLSLPTAGMITDPAPTLATTATNTTWENDWEKPQQSFEVLGQWSEVVPTDGVHVETHLSHTSVADEQTRAKLMRIEDVG